MRMRNDCKTGPALLVAALAGILTTGSRAGTTLEWGSEVLSSLVDSKGEVLGQNYIFELGAFANGFIPNAENYIAWETHWRTFDRAAYNSEDGYFTSTVNTAEGGVSDSPYLTEGSGSFDGLDAYLWVRDVAGTQPGTEWMLTRSATWTFSTNVAYCGCAKDLPEQWSLSDLKSSDIPIWGSQGGITGEGGTGTEGNFTLQTFTVIPEPSVALLAAAFVIGAGFLRRR